MSASQFPLDRAELRDAWGVSAGDIREELKELILTHGLRPPDAINKMFDVICPGGSHRERLSFIAVAASIARHVAILHANPDVPIIAGIKHTTISDLKIWLEWLDGYDAVGAQMIDLYCFGGLSIEDVASVLGFPPESVRAEMARHRDTLSLRMSS